MTHQQLLSLAVPVLCGTVIPALVDLVTKSRASHLVKGTVALVLSALAGSLSVVSFTPGESWSAYVLAIAVAFFATITAHSTGYTNAIQQLTAPAGLGNPRPVTSVTTRPPATTAE